MYLCSTFGPFTARGPTFNYLIHILSCVQTIQSEAEDSYPRLFHGFFLNLVPRVFRGGSFSVLLWHQWWSARGPGLSPIERAGRARERWTFQDNFPYQMTDLRLVPSLYTLISGPRKMNAAWDLGNGQRYERFQPQDPLGVAFQDGGDGGCLILDRWLTRR